MADIEKILEKIRFEDKAFQQQLEELENRFCQTEPEIHAFVPEEGRFDRLRREINRLQKKFPEPQDRPPLFGLLLGVKDIFHVDGFSTKAGSKIPAEELSGSEAVIVTQLKKQGAIVLGKTVTTEFAYFAPGPTRNPHQTDHTPGGSSSGSAAAVAVGFTSLALGSQTIGSVIRPASYCGVVGFKPTYGRISTEGVIPLAPSVDTVGFFTDTPANTVFLGKNILKDWVPITLDNHKPVLGIPIGPYLDQASPEMRHFYEAVGNKLISSGYSVLEIAVMDNFEDISRHHNNLVAYEAARSHECWFYKFQHMYHPKTIDLITRGQTVKEKEYKEGLESRFVLRDQLIKTQKRHGIDLWISPPAQGAAPKGLESTGSPIMNLPWTHCGVPTINLPVGTNNAGLPMGLQISGEFNYDEALLAWAEKVAADLA